MEILSKIEQFILKEELKKILHPIGKQDNAVTFINQLSLQKKDIVLNQLIDNYFSHLDTQVFNQIISLFEQYQINTQIESKQIYLQDQEQQKKIDGNSSKDWNKICLKQKVHQKIGLITGIPINDVVKEELNIDKDQNNEQKIERNDQEPDFLQGFIQENNLKQLFQNNEQLNEQKDKNFVNVQRYIKKVKQEINQQIIQEKQEDQKQILEHHQKTNSNDDLPIFSKKKELLDLIQNNQVIIVIGETGSGKTTQMPQFFYQSNLYDRSKVIGITQPRWIAAKTVAKRVAEEMHCKLGQLVGYSVRFDEKTSKETKIKYLTDGMLIREMLVDPLLLKYQMIIIDEVHERKLMTDLLMGLIKNTLQQRKDGFKVIITSATLNSQKFSDFFNKCPILNIEGRCFPVEILYQQDNETDYLQSSINCIQSIHLNHPQGDILCFLTGQEEIETAQKVLENKNLNNLLVFPLYANLSHQQQNQIFDIYPSHFRKVILATNIAEASVTIDGVVYVVDSGYHKINIYNSKLSIEQLLVSRISRQQADQWAGRAGRTRPGKCFWLFTEEDYYNRFPEITSPEIQRVSLDNLVLILKSLKVNDIFNFPFFDIPERQNINYSLYWLYYLEALDQNGSITAMGKLMSCFPLEPNHAKMLLVSIDLGCSQEICILLAMLQNPEVFLRPKNNQAKADSKHKYFHQKEGDHMTLIYVFKKWFEQSQLDWKYFCKQFFLNHKALQQAYDIWNQLQDQLKRMKFQIQSCEGNNKLILMCVVAGNYSNICLKQKGVVKLLSSEDQVQIHPSSVLNFQQINCVVFEQQICGQKQYIRIVSKVEQGWLNKLCPWYYQPFDPEKKNEFRQNQSLQPIGQRAKDPNKDDWKLSRRIVDISKFNN